MAMKSVVLPIGALNLDSGPTPGDHAWVIQNAWNLGSGLERVPGWTESAVTITGQPAGDAGCGIYSWNKGTSHRIYFATNTQIWEVASAATDVSGSAYTNNTNGVRFTSFGSWCLAANGVDKLQIIEVPTALAGAQNFSDHDSNVYATISSLSAVISPRYICSHKNHVIAADITFKSNYGSIGSFSTTGAGFTNQPNDDTITAESDGADTRLVTVYGTVTGGGDTVWYKDNVALTGAVPVTIAPPVGSGATKWEKILAVKVATTSGARTITFREASGALAITTIGVGASSSGVYSVPAANQQVGGVTVTMAADAATTRSVGLGGDSNSSGDYDYDSQALSGTTSVVSNMSYVTLLEVFTGDLEAARTVTVTIYAFPAGTRKPYMWWVSQIDSAINFGDETFAPSLTGSTREEAMDGDGDLSGVIDGGDAWYLFKEKSIHKIAGPPWQPVVISRSIGMIKGTSPYRQGDRIYFESEYGLYYIETSTNEVVPLYPGRLQVATSGGSNFSYGFNSGSYPDPASGSTVTAKGIFVITGSNIRISGDSRFGLVYVANPHTAYDSYLVYNEKLDEFFIMTDGEPDRVFSWITETDTFNTDKFPGSQLVGVKTTGIASVDHDFWYATQGGFNSTTPDAFDTYVLLPFKVLSNSEYVPTQVQAIKPIYNSNHVNATANTLGIRARIYSMSGQGKSWTVNGIFSTSNSSSKDGWYRVDSCPFATCHAIGFTIGKGTTGSGHKASFSGLVGVEVKYMAGPAQAQ